MMVDLCSGRDRDGPAGPPAKSGERSPSGRPRCCGIYAADSESGIRALDLSEKTTKSHITAISSCSAW